MRHSKIWLAFMSDKKLIAMVMNCVQKGLKAVLLAIVLMLGCVSWSNAAASSPHAEVKHHRRHKILKKAEWTGAGLAASKVAGPAGSAGVGIAKYRHDLKAGGKKRTRAIAKMGAPIAAGAVAGPAGTAGYEAVEHRNWIKRHILRRKSH